MIATLLIAYGTGVVASALTAQMFNTHFAFTEDDGGPWSWETIAVCVGVGILWPLTVWSIASALKEDMNG